jgi:predicted TIM-barrel enzyme
VAYRICSEVKTPTTQSLSQRYPKYYKPVGELTEVDVYAVHQLFSLDDVSGCIHHASKKLLLSGVRTGGKTKQQDIREARDTLNRWLELNGEGV